MKKSILVTVLLLCFFIGSSQNANLFNRDWHIHELSINGSLVDIPMLPEDPPADCIVGLRFEDFDTNDFIINPSICWDYSIFLDDFDGTNFTVVDWVGLGEGSCYFGSTGASCEAPPVGNGELLEFGSTHVDFYRDIPTTFTYTILPPGSEGYETLHIEKPNGDYAIYGEEPPLSIDSNSLDMFSVYPNPASNVLYLKGKVQDIKTIAVHTLSGQKMNVKIEGDKVDVSHLASGLYFISVTTVEGQKGVQKFLKK